MSEIHAATSPELTKLRSNGQASILHAALITPPVLFRARVNQAFTQWDCLTKVTYDGVTYGSYGSILQDM